jgi:hypothetical protein
MREILIRQNFLEDGGGFDIHTSGFELLEDIWGALARAQLSVQREIENRDRLEELNNESNNQADSKAAAFGWRGTGNQTGQ